MDSEHDRLRRIVRVEATFDHRDPLKGTGFRVAPGQILTAQHVVDRARDIRVLADPQGTGHPASGSAKVVWQGEGKLDPEDRKALDAALLEDELPADDLESFLSWVSVPLGESGRWETSGFASASPDKELEYLWGVCHPAKELATYLKLSIERDASPDPQVWKGVSGSPVFVKEGPYKGHLYGVVRSSPKPLKDELFAVGTPALLRDKELRQRLGIKDPMPPHVSLVEELRELLEEDSWLAGQLAKLDGTWEDRWNHGGTDELVDAICAKGSLKKSLEQLRRLYRGAKPGSAKQIRELAMVLVSVLASRELPGGEELTAESTRRIQLGTASPNFAETLLASAYGTPCHFEKAADRDLPRAYLRVPTAEMEAGIRGKNLVDEQLEELVLNLMEKDLDPKFLLPAHRSYFNHETPIRRRELLTETLERRLVRLKEDEGRPAYLVAESDLKMKMGSRMGAFLHRLEKVLPSLHFVVLDTDSEKKTEAIKQDDELWPLWEILDLLPKEE